jgi:DeoR/GlpR family transcriptional regulator of sugar metabolism
MGKSVKKRRKTSADAEERREYILATLQSSDSGRLAFKKVTESYDVSVQTLYHDAEVLQKRDHAIDVGGMAFFRTGVHRTTYLERRDRRKRQKDAVGRLARTLIAPEQSVCGDLSELRRSELAQTISASLADSLESLWQKARRAIILDAGSTTKAIADELVKLKTPSPERRLSSLRVLTNGLMIVESLKQMRPPYLHGIIQLGGSVRHDTEAIAGTLAEWCLESWRFSADVAFIGTTNLNNNDWTFCCDSEEEAQIKSALLHKARIRCIVADSSKLLKPKSGSNFPFASLAPSDVDMIVTDYGLFDKKNGATSSLQAVLKRARDHKIFIAIGAEKAQ